MKKSAFALAVIVAMFASIVLADEYEWKAAEDGNWNDSTKWTSSTGTTYPGAGDNVKGMPWGEYTVTLTESVTTKQISPQKGGGVKTFALGGNTLTLTGNGNNHYIFPSVATSPLSPGDEAYSIGVLFT